MEGILIEALTGDDKVFTANNFEDLVANLSQQDGFNPLSKEDYMEIVDKRLISLGRDPICPKNYKEFILGCVVNGIIECILIKGDV